MTTTMDFGETKTGRRGSPNFAYSKADGETKGGRPTTARILRNIFYLQRRAIARKVPRLPLYTHMAAPLKPEASKTTANTGSSRPT
jgi:hypothetical protein